MTANCETCLYWLDDNEGDWSECMLTSPEAHETLTEQVLYIAGEQDGEKVWLPIEGAGDITAILHTRKDYGCVQYEKDRSLS